MPKTFQFLAPSLHPNTLVDLAIPEAGPSTPEPIVRHLPIKYGQHQAVRIIKRMALSGEDHVVVADDAFRLSTLSLGKDEAGMPTPPGLIRQHQAVGKAGNVWAGVASVQGNTLAALSSGNIHLMPTSVDSEVRTTSLSGPLNCIASSSSTSTCFAAAGKEVDVSVWDIERTLAATPAEGGNGATGGKRKKGELREGEMWQAKNLAHDYLNLRPPIHHLALTFAPSSSTSIVSGTKSGSIRRYDTRQRKPLSDWKVAREGGIGAISFGLNENELFYADRASLLAALDIRTGKMLYSIPSTCTVHHLFSFPSVKESSTGHTSGRNIGLAGVSSDATLRLYATTPVPQEGVKGNWGGEGKKGGVVSMVGGVGVGGFVWRGHGETAKVRSEKQDGEELGDEDEDEEDEDMWEGMDAIGDDESEGDEDDSDDEDEEEAPPVKKKKQQPAQRGLRRK